MTIWTRLEITWKALYVYTWCNGYNNIMGFLILYPILLLYYIPIAPRVNIISFICPTFWGFKIGPMGKLKTPFPTQKRSLASISVESFCTSSRSCKPPNNKPYFREVNLPNKRRISTSSPDGVLGKSSRRAFAFALVIMELIWSASGIDCNSSARTYWSSIRAKILQGSP